MDVATVLNAAADLIEPEGAWTQDCFAKDADGLEVGEQSKLAVCWCTRGAVLHVVGRDLPGDQWDDIARAFGFEDYTLIEAWNDAPDRTQAEVVTALRQAAQRAKESGHGG